jgi:hypothetical protein
VDGEARTDRQMIELLNELRVALPGVQILFGVLLTVPFSSRADDMTDFQRALLGACIVLTALSAACLIAPSAAHRIRFHQGDRPWLIESASRLLLAGLLFLGLAMTCAVLLVGDVLYGPVAAAAITAVVALALLGLWLLLPVRRGRRGPAERRE